MQTHRHALPVWLGTTAAACLAAVVLLALPQPARAAIDCWMDAEHPKTGDGLAVSDARVAPMRSALHELNAALHRQAELHALPRTRLRSSWQIGGQWTAPARAASFLLRDHRESMWASGCSVIAGADRLGPRASVVVTVNAPEVFFETAAPELADEQLRAWREMPATGSVQGRTLYGGRMLVFTRDGRLPWVPVSTAEYIDFTLRDLGRKAEEERASRAALPATPQAREEADEAQLRKVVEAMRKVDPAGAERMAVELRAQQAAARAHAEAMAKRRAARGLDDNPLQTMITRVQAWRDSLTPQQLAAQARLGLNGLHPGDVPPERFAPLVKPDPAYPWDTRQPARPQLLMVSVLGGGEFEEPMQRVLQTLDLNALQALVH